MLPCAVPWIHPRLRLAAYVKGVGTLERQNLPLACEARQMLDGRKTREERVGPPTVLRPL